MRKPSRRVGLKTRILLKVRARVNEAMRKGRVLRAGAGLRFKAKGKDARLCYGVTPFGGKCYASSMDVVCMSLRGIRSYVIRGNYPCKNDDGDCRATRWRVLLVSMTVGG